MIPSVRKKKRVGRKVLALLVILYAAGYIIHSFLPGSSHQEPSAPFLEALEKERQADSAAHPAAAQPAAEAKETPVASTPAPAVTPEETPVAVPDGPGGLHGVSLSIRGSFFTSLKKHPRIRELTRTLKTKRLADMLCSHVQRPLVWHGNPVKNSLRNDRCDFVFRVIDDTEKRERNDIPDDIEVMAVRFSRAGSDRTIRMYVYTAADKKYSKFYYADGTRVEPVLAHSPISEYIQMTAPFAEARGYRHQGADFKTPVGTPLYAPFSGVVSRINWITKNNGNCLEITLDRQPYTVKMLHLNRVAVKKHQTVQAGQLVAYSGDTGRSYAPHLHYQVNVNKRGRAIDPFRFHKTRQEKLPDADMAAFKERVREYDRLMDGSSSAVAGR